MISEILDILGSLARPIKKDNPNDSVKNFIVFFSYVISIVCIIFIIPEYKAIINLENSLFFIFTSVAISIVLAFLSIYILWKLNLIPELVFSTLLTFAISIMLLYILIIFLLNDYLNFL
ncbi:hypothetical protein [Flavobacterium suncheonense]|uniref:Uncharacterized protein n=1 Tax=Flavobacterium suncheonense GH29-5 = DSM 17707 TaxID=1121899 RepID=A0A0A2M364_9FLAO|nr:hypothetical protein [Flavobacterium suncheonense]KGO86669.1 hypothetical protein Q764_13570 [Flavobacterium suncheonense GH29-5 = DSM 17707]